MAQFTMGETSDEKFSVVNNSGHRNILDANGSRSDAFFITRDIMPEVFRFLNIYKKVPDTVIENKWKLLLLLSLQIKCFSISSIKDDQLSEKFDCSRMRLDKAKLCAPLLKLVFDRCGPFISELDLTQFKVDNEALKLIASLPNLKHLKIYHLKLDAAAHSHLMKICRQLKCLEIHYYDCDGFGLDNILKSSSQLEFLRFEDHTRRYKCNGFTTLPKSLKELVIDGTAIAITPLLDQLVAQGIQLQSFVLPTHEQLASVELFVGSFPKLAEKLNNFKSLKCVRLYLASKELLRLILSLLEPIDNLRSFTVHLSFHIEEFGFDEEIINMIADKFSNLEHVTLRCQKKAKGLLSLLRLPNLCSVEVGDFNCSDEVCKLFDNLALRGKLQYFSTALTLSIESVCNALERCKELRYILCKFDHGDFKLLYETLTKVHQNDTFPTGANDPRLLCLADSTHDISHPWIKYKRVTDPSSVKVPASPVEFGYCAKQHLSEVPLFIASYFEHRL